MKNHFIYMETTILVVLALILIVIDALALHIDLLNAIYPSEAWVKRGLILHYMMAICGVAVVVAAAGSLFIIRNSNRTLTAHCFAWSYSILLDSVATCKRLLAIGGKGSAIPWLTLIVAVGAVNRSFHLSQPMRYDESFTFLNFVNGPFIDCFYYPLPNNHVLHTLLVKISVGLLGNHPVAIRLPSVLAGILVIPMCFLLSRSLTGNNRSGYLAAALVAIFPYLIVYDTTARGYSLLVLLSLCLAWIGVRVTERPSMRLYVLMALVIACGALDMPSFLYPAAGLLCWVGLMQVQRRRKLVWILTRELVPCILVAALLVWLFYTPVFFVNNGIDSVFNNRFAESLSWHEFIAQLPSHISHTGNQFIRNVPILLVCGSLLLLVAGLCFSLRARQWGVFMLIPSVAFGGAVVFFGKHAIPYDRTWIYFLPLVFIVMDAGLVALAKCPAVYVKSLSFLFAVCATVVIMSRDIISQYPDGGHFPEAPMLADVLAEEMTVDDKIVVECPADEPLRYYMWCKGVPRKDRCPDDQATSREFVAVKPSLHSITNVTNLSMRRLLKIGDAELYVRRQDDDAKAVQSMEALGKQ